MKPDEGYAAFTNTERRTRGVAACPNVCQPIARSAIRLFSGREIPTRSGRSQVTQDGRVEEYSVTGSAFSRERIQAISRFEAKDGSPRQSRIQVRISIWMDHVRDDSVYRTAASFFDRIKEVTGFN